MRGVWISQVEALFDARVTDIDASSNGNHSVASAAVLESAEEEKKSKHLSAAELPHASFTLFQNGQIDHACVGVLQLI